MAAVIDVSEFNKLPWRGPARVDFWGYGLEADPSVIEQIAQTNVGLYVVGGIKKAVARDSQLVIQGIGQVPERVNGYSPRDILAKNWEHTGEPFASYSIVHIEGAQTAGTLYVITNLAIVKALNEWDMVPDWRSRDTVTFDSIDGTPADLPPTMTFSANGSGKGLPYERVVDGLDYETHLFGEENTRIAVQSFHKQS